MFNRSGVYAPGVYRSERASRAVSQERDESECADFQLASHEEIRPKFFASMGRRSGTTSSSRLATKLNFSRPDPIELPLDTRSFFSNKSRFLASMTKNSSQLAEPHPETKTTKVKLLNKIRNAMLDRAAHPSSLNFPSAPLEGRSVSSNMLRQKIMCQLRGPCEKREEKPKNMLEDQGGRPVGRIPERLPILSKEAIHNLIRTGVRPLQARPGPRLQEQPKPILRRRNSKTSIHSPELSESTPTDIAQPTRRSVKFSSKVLVNVYRKD
jgi:hypothetical protein